MCLGKTITGLPLAATLNSQKIYKTFSSDHGVNIAILTPVTK